uniref:Uncharacterized protein n=1 Tax=Amphimedon queenslandica TaxID=400682 RepID=A0A1X7U1S8_AMPQE
MRITSAKSEYEATLVTAFYHSPQLLYCHLRRFASSPPIPESVFCNGTMSVDACSKVDLFNSVFTSTDFLLPPMDQLPTPSNELSSIDTSCKDVYLALMSLNLSKPFGYD